MCDKFLRITVQLVEGRLKKRRRGGFCESSILVFLKADTQTPIGFVMNMRSSEAEAGFDIQVPPTADLEELEDRIAEERAPASRNMTFEYLNQDEYLKGVDVYASIIKS